MFYQFYFHRSLVYWFYFHSDYTIVDGDLLISRVRPEDAGTYVCHAENENGRTDTPVSLNVGDLVPRFTQNPNSYMSYQPMNDVYLDFDILLSLRPESTEGIIQYSNMITHWIFFCTRFVTSILIGRCDKLVTIEYFLYYLKNQMYKTVIPIYVWKLLIVILFWKSF